MRGLIPGSSPATRIAVASMMRVFRACPASDSRLLGGLPRTDSGAAGNQNSLLTGKKAGNFSDSAISCENRSQKHLRIQLFRNEFPTHRNSQAVVSPNCHRFVETDPGRLIVR